MTRLFLISLISLLGCIAPIHETWAADKIGLSLPLTGRFQEVASRMEFGALQAVEDLKKSGQNIELVIADDRCDPLSAGDIAGQFLTQKVRLIIGPVCFQFATALSKALEGAQGAPDDVPVVTFNTRNKLLKRLRDVDELPLFSVSNTHDAEAQAVVEEILPRFNGKPFGILDDGSVYGRALADSIRLLGDQVGLKAVVNTNFRPLQNTQLSMIRRLRNSGVEAVFIAAAAEDVATITKDIKTLGLNWKIATGERGVLLPFTVDPSTSLNGLLMVREEDLTPVVDNVSPESALADPSSLAGYILVQLAAQAISDPMSSLTKDTFKTAIGPLKFNENGRAPAAAFKLYRWDNGGFVPQGTN